MLIPDDQSHKIWMICIITTLSNFNENLNVSNIQCLSKSCYLDSTFVTVTCLHKSFVVLSFYIILILDMLEMYAKLRVIDLCRLYYYHIYHTQITHLSGLLQHLLFPSSVCIIETPSKCTYFFFYQWLNN